MPSFDPVWLDVADVKKQLWMTGDSGDDDLITRCAAAVEPQVQRARPDQLAAPTPAGRDARGRITAAVAGGYYPDAEVYQAAVMLAAKLVRRRNSSGGQENFGQSTLYATQFDPETAVALHSGPYRMPGVG